MIDVFFDLNYQFSRGIELNLINLNVSVSLDEDIDDASSSTTPIGEGNLYLLNPRFYSNWLNLMLEADAESGELIEIARQIEKTYEQNHSTGLILFVEKLVMHEPYCGIEYEMKLMNEILKDMQYLNVAIACIIPKNKKLQSLYQGYGLDRVNLDESVPVMARHLNLVEH